MTPRTATLPTLQSWRRRAVFLVVACLTLLGAQPVRADPTPEPPASVLGTRVAFAQTSSVAPDEAWLLIANPGRLSATVRLTLYPDASTPAATTVVLAPGTRQAVYANAMAPSAAFATLVESDQPVVVERSVYRGDTGGSTAAMVPQRSWWLTGGAAPSSLHALVAFNPGDVTATVSLYYALSDGSWAGQSVVLPARSRVRIDPSSAGISESGSVRVESDQPIVVERALDDADGVLGVPPSTAKSSRLWYFPGATLNGGSGNLQLLNVSEEQATIAIDQLAPIGRTPWAGRTLDPGARLEVPLPRSPADYGLQVRANVPIVALLSRPLADGKLRFQPGAPDLGWTWLFAEGTVSGIAPAELRILNPNGNPAQVRARLLDEHGSGVTLSVTAPAGSLTLLDLADAGPARATGVAVESDLPIAVERIQPLQRSGVDTVTAALGTSPDAIHFQGRDVLDGRFLLLNMPAMLFREDTEEIRENIRYARWMNAGAIRVFTTDPILYKGWSGAQLGARIVEIAPDLRANGVRLIVPLVSNYQPVPGETERSFGLKDDFYQLLLPFYQGDWRGAYLSFSRDLISTVRNAGALDVIAAWEIGNELHTQDDPPLLLPFMREMSAEIRALDPYTPTLSGTMGINHIDPWNMTSPIARALYCEMPFDAYTVHTYDWIDRSDGGDMPIDWDLDNITNSECPSGRRLRVIAEELGTTKALRGHYRASDEDGRLAQELHQIRFVLSYPIVAGIGAWSAESPLVEDPTYFDSGRGLTSYGPDSNGTGSCYPDDLGSTKPRCRLETVLRALPSIP
jgi:hypothetical protein